MYLHINLYSFPHRRTGRRRIRIFARVPFRPSPGRCHRRRCRRLPPPTRRAWVQHHQVKSELPNSGFIQWAHSHSHTRICIVSYYAPPPSTPPTKLSLKVVQNYKNLQDYSTLSAFIYLIHYNPFWQKNQKRKNKKNNPKIEVANHKSDQICSRSYMCIWFVSFFSSQHYTYSHTFTYT